MGVIADWHIVVLKQTKPIPVDFSSLSIAFKTQKSVSHYYGYNWSVVGAFNGIDYDLYPVKDGEYDYSDGFFNYGRRERRQMLLPDRLSVEELRNILGTFIQSSPIKAICWLTRIDPSDDNRIVGTLSLKDFLKKYANGSLEFNKAYIVTEKARSNN